jgi:hypothetical protein
VQLFQQGCAGTNHQNTHLKEKICKMYLFGGYINSNFIPCHLDFVSKPLHDPWELWFGVPGGYFNIIDLEEIRTAKIGPYQRCFACSNMKGCGGSFKGVVGCGETTKALFLKV